MTADEPIRLVPADPGWPERFVVERVALEGAIGEWVAGGIHQPEPRSGYAVLKRDLAAAHPRDREAYTEGKSDFIATALQSRGSFRTS